jgi:hypothetical protein
MIRKIYNVLALLLITVATAVAQDATTSTSDIYSLTNKKGEKYLPAADEWAIGVSATPFLGYLGNFLNFGGNSAPTFDYASNPANNIAIFGKKMIDQNTAWRVRFNVGVNSAINKGVVVQDQLNADPAFPAFSEDWRKTNTTSVVIAPGYEKRRGSTRLQGIYGGELVIGYSSSKVAYDYGNQITQDFQTPTSFTGFGGNLSAGGSVRQTENKAGGNFLVGARGFIGVEYFFAPKISIGGEFGYMVAFQTQGRGLVTTQTWDAANNNVRETKTDVFNSGGLTNIGIGIDNLSGSINLLFYF